MMTFNNRQTAGFTILEMFISTLLLAGVMVLAAMLFRTVALQRQTATRQLIMVEAAQNLMDEVTLITFQDLNEETASTVVKQHKKFSMQQGFQSELTIEQIAQPSAKRVVIALQRLEQPDERKKVRLVSWVYPVSNK